MAHLFNRRILLAVCGGIAAYKSAELVRRLQDLGAEVRVLMTRGAQEFITPLTLQALSGHPVHHSLLDEEAERAMGHIELARWADLLLIAPATADCLARLVAGRADDLLGAVALATPAPVLLAPAMNQQMWKDPATQANLETLTSRGMHTAGPDSGEQACGDVGPGRMLEPQQLLDLVAARFAPGKLDGVDILLTAGPTREAIDPVRFISNRSSGKMGYAVAAAALEQGARVTLVSGPVALQPPAGSRVIGVESAQEMYDAVMREVEGCDIFIACAAVSDYRVAVSEAHKIKKSDAELTLRLSPNPDILAAVSAGEARPFCVGFAAETRDVERYARDKLERKKLDMIAANLVGDEHSGFEIDFNQLEVYWPEGHRSIDRASKSEIATRLIDLIAERYTAARS